MQWCLCRPVRLRVSFYIVTHSGTQWDEVRSSNSLSMQIKAEASSPRQTSVGHHGFRSITELMSSLIVYKGGVKKKRVGKQNGNTERKRGEEGMESV